eukprot:GHUV01057536.1.p1 GENE.GHUV01057536.1~~GHUV01057536.1.p1  ORF type:complete len:189 (+),score=56.67 GHUV01057536.1:734-1300(+)
MRLSLATRTLCRYPATMHGAFATGLREAARVMAAFAHQRGEDVHLRQQQGVPEVDEATAAEGLDLIKASQLLQQVQKVFDDQQLVSPALGLQFGIFSAVFGPPDSDLEDQAIVAVDISTMRGKNKQAVSCFYMTLNRAQLELLQEIPGDDRRLAVLISELAVRPLARRLNAKELSLLEAIATHRQQRV